jgi:NAD(P)-dependent dehydrogenase (short-subunit alcohol dehydrogenase family)
MFIELNEGIKILIKVFYFSLNILYRDKFQNMNKSENYSAPKDLLKDRVVLITGAGQGLGRAAALTYANYGATVILHGRKVKELESVYDEIETIGKAQALIYPLDLEHAEENDFAVIAQAIEQQLGRLDGILHNAAFLYGLSPLENQTVQQWRTMLQVNLITPFALTKACLPLLKVSPDASVIMTSSSHGHKPSAYWGGFTVAKAGIEALVKVQADEWESMPNLRINTIIPGIVNSPQRAKTHPGEIKQTMRQPEDLMTTYLYLMGPDSKGMSGETVSCYTEY